MHQACKREEQEYRHAEEHVELVDRVDVPNQRRIRTQIKNALYPVGESKHRFCAAFLGMVDRDGDSE